MIDLLIRAALRNRVTVLGLSSTLLVVGLWLTSSTPVDVFPDLTAPTVTILTEGHGLSPVEMETQVTFPIETTMNGATGVRRVRSGTAVGISVVWVEFAWGTDIHRARQTVSERLASVAAELPEQVDSPTMAPVSSIMGEILFLSLTSDRHDPITLRTTASAQIRRRLLAVPGVSQVTPIGGDVKQYQVVLSPERLLAYDITAEGVIAALRAGNENVAGGVVARGPNEAILEGIGRLRDVTDIANSVVGLRGEVPVTVGDLGVVKVGPAFKRGTASASRRGGAGEPIIEPGVVIAVQKQPGANTLELTQRLDDVLDEIQAGLPAGMVVNKDLFRQASFIETSIENTLAALLEGAAMVVLVVLVFLANLRASAITLVALPLSLLVAVLVLRGLGDTINTMTLGGMAIAIGALVDDAIIDVENVIRRLRENRSRAPAERRSAAQVVYDASVEVRVSIVLATALIVLVFTPLFFLSGVEGRLLAPLGLAFCVALAASLLVALTVTPVLCILLLPNSRTVTRATEPAVVRGLKRVFAPVLDGALAHPWMLSLAALVLAGFSGWTAMGLGRSFLPEFNEGAMVVGVVTLPGTSLEESDRLAGAVEEILMQHPEVVAIGRRTGRAEQDEHVQGVEASEIDLTLDMAAPARRGLPVRSRSELLEALRRDVAGVPGVRATFGQPIGHRIDHMLSGTRASVAIKIFGDDLATLRDIARAAETSMRDVPGVVDLSSEQQAMVPTLSATFDRAALARHGLHVEDAARSFELASRGVVAGQVLEGTLRHDLLVRVGEPRNDPHALGRVRVPTPSGGHVPLHAVADIREDLSPNFVSREDVQRKTVVMCNVAGRDVGSVVSDLRAALSDLSLPPGYRIAFSGQFESAQATATRLLWLGACIVAALAGLLYAGFRSLSDTLLVMVNLPLALLGGVWGVVATGGTLSVASLIGFITVFGVAARNGIMLVSHIRHLQLEEGVTSFPEAVRRGTLERLSPILMTAVSAALALVPLALRGDRPGNEILSPMAAVIVFGLVSATALNMALVPTLYLHFGRPPGDAGTRRDATEGGAS